MSPRGDCSPSRAAPLRAALTAQVATGVPLPRPPPFDFPQSPRACVKGGIKHNVFNPFPQSACFSFNLNLSPRPPRGRARPGRGCALRRPRGSAGKVAGAAAPPQRAPSGRAGWERGWAGRAGPAPPDRLGSPALPFPPPPRPGPRAMGRGGDGRRLRWRRGRPGKVSATHTPRRSAEGRRPRQVGSWGRRGGNPPREPLPARASPQRSRFPGRRLPQPGAGPGGPGQPGSGVWGKGGRREGRHRPLRSLSASAAPPPGLGAAGERPDRRPGDFAL